MTTVFTKTDVANLVRKEELQAELAKLDKKLKPKIEAACNEFGEVGTIRAGGHTVEFRQIVATSVPWKNIATDGLSVPAVERAVKKYSKIRTTNKAKVVE